MRDAARGPGADVQRGGAAAAAEPLGDPAERYRSVVAAMSEGVVFFDASGQIVDCNPAAERIIGLARAQILQGTSRGPWPTLRDDGSPMPADEYPVTITLRTGQAVRGLSMGYDRPDGERRWLVMNSEPLVRPGEAAPYAVVTSFEDVTAARAATEAVRLREEQLRVALECAEHAWWEIDLPERRFRCGTPWTLVGWAADALDGTLAAWEALVHPEDRAGRRLGIAAHVEQPTAAYDAEYRVRTPRGAYRWLRVRGRAVGPRVQGRATRLSGIAADVTEERTLRDRLRAADRLASVGSVAAGVAHEVNNPLAAVVSDLTYLAEALERAGREGAAALDARELREVVGEAQHAAGRVRGIVRGLHLVAAPRSRAERVRVDPRAELEAALDLTRNELTHRARLVVDAAAPVPAVLAAPGDLPQILMALLLNAAHALPEGEAARQLVTVALRAAGDAVEIAVSDSGPGLGPDERARAFEPFFARRASAPGGLGLAVSQGLVAALGGRIDVESGPGDGALFRVTLPAAPEPPPAPRPPTPHAPRARILVVDDDPLVGRSLGRILSDAHDVEVLASPREALRRVQAGEAWDVVLCDLMMPELSGMELEAQIRATAPAVADRMIFLTGGAFTAASEAFLASGRPHLVKPVEVAELRAVVAARLRR